MPNATRTRRPVLNRKSPRGGPHDGAPEAPRRDDATGTVRHIRPNSTPQEQFLASRADIAIYGGSAGAGKTFSLLLETTRYINNPNHTFVVFRRETPQIRNPGGLWDESTTLYPHLGGVPTESTLTWTFPSGAWGKFAHMEQEKDRLAWDGAQIPLICFDQLEHFTEKQFWYMLSRNRSARAGYRPYIRATCNPDPDSFLAELMAWYIDQESGYAIPERSGALRFFYRDGDKIEWFNDEAEAMRAAPRPSDVKSFTFILGKLSDNADLMRENPEYEANMRALSRLERLRLYGDGDKGGNWKVRPSAGLFFKKHWFRILPSMIGTPVSTIRYWDRGATPEESGNDPSWTVGVKITQVHGCEPIKYIVEDVVRFRDGPAAVARMIEATAKADGRGVIVGIEQDPGAAGKAEAYNYVTLLDGFEVVRNVVRENKGKRAGPTSALAEVGGIALLRASWNHDYLTEMENFDGTDEGHADQVDATTGGHYVLSSGTVLTVAPIGLPGVSSFKGKG